MALFPVKLVGIGRIWNLTDDVELGTLSEVQLARTIEELEIAAGSSYESEYIPTKGGYAGRLGFRAVTPELTAALIGGTTSTGSIKQVESEAGAVPSSPGPYTVALDHTPYAGAATYAAITVVGSDGTVFEQVAGSSEAAGKFSHSSGTLTFHEDDADAVFSVSYMWNDTSAGLKVMPTPGTLVGAKEYEFGIKGYDTIAGVDRGYVTFYVKKLQITGELPIGAAVGDVANIVIGFRATVTTATDLVISFPNA